jgi:hypothetical protein
MNFTHDSAQQQRLNPEDYANRSQLKELLFNSPIPKEEILLNIGLYLDRRMLSRFLFVQEMYAAQLKLHGSIFEFGVRYGQNLALLTSLRGIYEPYNHNRKIVGFDTFSGFPEVDAIDTEKWKAGDFNVPDGYQAYLEHILSVHEKLAPVESIKKFELVQGDATQTVHAYLEAHPETIISMAYFDFDIYKPTADCLKAIKPYLNRGAVIGFDEINDREWPGETAALREILGTSSFEIRHSTFRANSGYLIYNP